MEVRIKGRILGILLLLLGIYQSGQSQEDVIKGVHIFSDSTFHKENFMLGWEEPDTLYDGLRAVVYFYDVVKYYEYKNESWKMVEDSLSEICIGQVRDYAMLRKTDPNKMCSLVRVMNFQDTFQNQITTVLGGLFYKDSLGTDDLGSVIASDSSGTFWRRIHDADIYPDWWAGMKDSKKIQRALDYGGSYSHIVFTPRLYEIDDEIFLDTFQNIYFSGNKAILKAIEGNKRNTTLNAPYNEGDYVIQVANVPSSWEPGDILVLAADSTNAGTSGRSQIDSIVDNTIYLKYTFQQQEGGLFPSQPQGVHVLKNLNIFRGKPSASEGGFGEAGHNKGTIFENFIFDGNKEENNTASLSWAVNNLISLHGRGSEIRSCLFKNAPSEVILGHGINVHDNVFENCNGSVYHLSAHDTTFMESYPAYFVNNTVLNCNTTPYAVSGHNEGLISFSWNGGYIIINGNYLVSGSNSNGVIGSLQGFQQGANDREIVILSSNYCKGFDYIVYGTQNQTTRSLMISGNIFEDCQHLAPDPIMPTSVRICGNVQVGTTNFGIDFRNSCQYQTLIDQSLGYGKQALLNTTENFNSAFGNYALESLTSGDFNVAMGKDAGKSIQTGQRNTFLGTWSGINMTGGNDNTIVGYWARGSSYSLGGDRNVHIGSEAGRSNDGDGNVFIGYSAGRYMDGNHQLVIHNNESNNPLIYGKFDERRVTINGSLHVDGPNLFRLPNVTLAERDNLVGLMGGEMIFNVTLSKLQVYNGSEWIDLH